MDWVQRTMAKAELVAHSDSSVNIAAVKQQIQDSHLEWPYLVDLKIKELQEALETNFNFAAKLRQEAIRERKVLLEKGGHKCSRCGEGFAYEDILGRHMSVAHRRRLLTAPPPVKVKEEALVGGSVMKREMALDTVNVSSPTSDSVGLEGEDVGAEQGGGVAVNMVEVEPVEVELDAEPMVVEVEPMVVEVEPGPAPLSGRKRPLKALPVTSSSNLSASGSLGHSCLACGQKLTRGDVLKKHMKKLHGEDGVSCYKCGELFVAIERMDGHMRGRHGVEQCVCIYCRKVVATLGDLIVHIRSNHADLPFDCKLCGYRYVACKNLGIHYDMFICVNYLMLYV